jgi:hypothetical protein
VTPLSKEPPVAVGDERRIVTRKGACVGATEDLTSQKALPAQPETVIGVVLRKLTARTMALTVATLLALNVVSPSRSTTVSVLPSAPAGLVAIGEPARVTRPENGAEVAQKNPAGRVRSTYVLPSF